MSQTTYLTDSAVLLLPFTFYLLPLSEASGDRSRESAKKLWGSLPPIYRQCAVCYTDFWEAYETVIPQKRHRAVDKASGQTNHIERFNNTLRQRISRLVRRALSFSIRLENHIGAIWNFIHHYNANLAN